MPLPVSARQPRRLNAEDGADLPIAHCRQQTFKAGAPYSGSRDPEIVVDDVDILPTQGACTIDKAILASFAFQIVPHLLWRGLTDVHTSPPGQMISGDLVHRRPLRASSSPLPAATAPALGADALARPVEILRRKRRAAPRKVVVGILLGTAAS